VACYVGDERLEIVRVLSDSARGSAAVNNKASVDGATPMMRCCESGAINCAKLLHDRGGDINALDNEGCSVLHWALQVSGAVSACSSLRCANVCPVSCVQFGRDDIVEWLLSLGAKRCPGRCMKCQLWSKMMDRRKQMARNAVSHGGRVGAGGDDSGGGTASPRLVEDTETVLQQEFGEMDLMEEIRKMKVEYSLLAGQGVGATAGDGAVAKPAKKSRGKGRS
jgi:hypothetical protein